MITIDNLGAPVVKLSSSPVDDSSFLLTVVHQLATPVAVVYHMLRDGNFREILRSSPLGKDDSATSLLFSDGTVQLVVSESDLYAGSSGSTNKVRIYSVQTDLRPASSSGIDTVARRAIAGLIVTLGRWKDALVLPN
jgi:hypothetical protein